MNENNTTNQSQEKNAIQKRNRNVKFWDGVGIALAVLAGQFIAVIIAAIVAVVLGYREPEPMMNVMMAIGLPLGFLIAVWIILRKRSLATTAWKWEKKYWRLIPMAYFLMLSVSYVFGGMLENIPGYGEMYEQYADIFKSIHPIVLIVAGAFTGPVCEEIIFRGIILKEFLKTYNPQKAIVFSSIIFGAIHMIPLQMIGAFFIGLVLGYVYYKTKSLWLPIVLHILNNLVAFLFGMGGEIETTREWFGNDVLYILSFVVAILIVFVLYRAFEKFHGPAREEEVAV